jgi:prepilin-type N-terminal cleavage/methylation domain-containing protein
MYRQQSQRGFTIVELLIVIVVIGILAAIVIVAFNGVQARSKATAKMNDLKSMQKIIMLYHADKGHYPISNGWRYQRSVGNDFIPGVVPEYASKLPQITDGPTTSTSNNTYIYRSDATGSEYKLMRLYQSPVPPNEYDNIPSSMYDQNPAYTDRWGVWSSGGRGF